MRLFTLLLFLPFISLAQCPTHDVVATDGGQMTGTTTIVDWTVGEISIETYTSTGYQLNQGFNYSQIPGYVNCFISANELEYDIEVNTFPVPTSGILNVQITNNSNTLQLSICDLTGRALLEDVYQGSSLVTMDLGGLASGHYLLRITSNEGIIKTIKIQKS